MIRVATILVLALACASPALAQQQPQELPPGHPPLGPRDVMQQAQEQREQQEQQGREERTTPPDQMHRILQGESPELVIARESAEVPAGTIRVTVVDAQGRPAGDQAVDVGILAQGARDRRNGRTNGQGLAEFRDLEAGGNKAYRVNVPYEGATYQSTPFRLPPDRGYDVRVTRLPTTNDEENLLSLLNRTFFELRDTRIHVVQQVQLVNLDDRTYVFPEEGKLVELPEGFTAWQWQEVMTDQRLSQVDEGFRMRGSIPPGRLTLTWAFDLDVSGSEMEVRVPVPFRTFAARVEADAPEGMEIEVEEMPEAQLHEAGQQRVYITERRFTPNEPAPSRFRVSLSGIPGPGPLRWLAMGGAVILLLAALLLLLAPRGRPAGSVEALADRKKTLLGEAVGVEKMFRANEIGPKYRSRQMDAIVAELAAVLRQEEAANATSAKGEAGKKAGRRA